MGRVPSNFWMEIAKNQTKRLTYLLHPSFDSYKGLRFGLQNAAFFSLLLVIAQLNHRSKGIE